MASLTATDIADVLKELYPNGAKDLNYRPSAFMEVIKTNTEAYGELIKVPLVYGRPQGRSAAFATAQSNQTAGKYEAFDVTLVSDYATASITGEAIDKSKKDKGSLVNALKAEMDGALSQLKRSAAHAIFRNGGGALGVISTGSTVGSAVITLSTIEDIVFFEIGQVLNVASTDGTSGAIRSGTVTVSAIDRDAGTVTATGNWTAGVAAVATGDSIFVNGDFGVKMKGLDAWVPATAPSSTAFFGVDRSVDTSRLGGVRYDGAAQSIEEALLDGIERVVRNGGMPDLVVVHPRQFTNLSKALGSKAVYDKRGSADGRFGFRTLKVDCAVGSIDIMADLNCQMAAAWVLQTDTWELYSIGDVPRMLDTDGLPYLRTASADAIELRCVYRAQLACKAPGFNGRTTLAT